MIPEFTLFRAVAAVLAAAGTAFVVNGIRHSFIDEAVIGTMLFILAWWLL